MINTNAWDVFISYASEDRETVAAPLAEALRVNGLRVWYDQFELTPGKQLLQSIDEGLRESRFGIVVLSPHFSQKNGLCVNWQDCIHDLSRKVKNLLLYQYGINSMYLK